jgi:hypothetical protein
MAAALSDRDVGSAPEGGTEIMGSG